MTLTRDFMVIILIAMIAGCAGEQPDGPPPNQPETPAAVKFTKQPSGAIAGSGPNGKPKRLFDTSTDDDEKTPLIAPEIVQGTGRVIGEPKSPRRTGVSQSQSGDVTLNVVDAEIRDVVRLVLEDALGVNYTIDPAVTGAITVRTSNPVPADNVIATLGSILSLSGVALVDAGGLYKVVPMDQAVAAGGRPLGRVAARIRGTQSGVQVAPLYHADATQLGQLLQPFVTGQGSVQVDTARNTLLLVGAPDQITTMTDLIDMFDVDWMDGMSFALYPLKSVGATQLAGELDQILGDPAVGIVAGGVRLVPIDRLSALIVIATQPENLGRIETWIDRLDKKGQGEGEQVYVYEVQNGRAADLASVLGELFDIRSTSVGADQLLAPGLEPVALGSSLSSFGADGKGDDGDVQDADGAQPGIGAAYGGKNGTQRSLTRGREDGSTRIVADETNNALLIRATAKEYRKIEAALSELDRQPLQVLLEATIAEVTLKDELSYGVQWFLGSDESSVTLSEFADGAVGQLFPGFSGLLSRGDVRVVLNALDSVSEVNVVSSPQILVLDNQTAQLEVGDEVPIVTQQAEGIETSDARIVNTVEQRQTGVILNVTPRVNANGLVVLDIQQEVSDVVRTTTSGIDSPTIAQRRIGTSVAVSSDQTIVLGGLIQDDVEEINSGVPLLKDIPLLGSLFSATTEITSRTELLVLITPKVLTDQNEAVAATDELRRRLWNLEPLHAKVRQSVVNGAVAENYEPSHFPEKRPVSEKRAAAAFMAQLSTASTAADAWNVWLALRQKHATNLNSFEPMIIQASSAGQNAFNLQVGPFGTAEDARALCITLHDNGATCRVIAYK
ncbi:MAG: type II secretion system secretin GspD [Geminicoccaceae bacterium]